MATTREYENHVSHEEIEKEASKILSLLGKLQVSEKGQKQLLVHLEKLGQFQFCETDFDSYHHRRLVQKTAELGVDQIVKAIVGCDPDQHLSILFNTVTLLTHCSCNSSVVRYLLSHRGELFAVLVETCQAHTGTGFVFNAGSIFALCLLRHKPPKISKELLTQHKLLEVLYSELLVVDFVEVTAQLARLCSRIAFVCHLLAAMGDAECHQIIKNHGIYSLLTSYSEDAKESDLAEDFVRHVDLLISTIDHGQDPCELTSLPAYRRMEEAWFSGGRYSLFCSSPKCEKEVCTDGVLFYCKLCKLAGYCDEKCQKQHWKLAHRKQCIGW